MQYYLYSPLFHIISKCPVPSLPSLPLPAPLALAAWGLGTDAAERWLSVGRKKPRTRSRMKFCLLVCWHHRWPVRVCEEPGGRWQHPSAHQTIQCQMLIMVLDCWHYYPPLIALTWATILSMAFSVSSSLAFRRLISTSPEIVRPSISLSLLLCLLL